MRGRLASCTKSINLAPIEVDVSRYGIFNKVIFIWSKLLIQFRIILGCHINNS